MRIIPPSYKIENAPDPVWVMEHLERCARTCYRSEGRIAPGTAERIIKKVIENEHESVIEHILIGVRFVCDRGVSHELVRHRLASFSQESTRFVRYDGEKEGRELTFILPCFWVANGKNESVYHKFHLWYVAMGNAERTYIELLREGAKPEEARSVLPHSLRTELVLTANLREWRHILKLRCSKAAHPQMRELMIPLRDELVGMYPVIFQGLKENDA